MENKKPFANLVGVPDAAELVNITVRLASRPKGRIFHRSTYWDNRRWYVKQKCQDIIDAPDVKITEIPIAELDLSTLCKECLVETTRFDLTYGGYLPDFSQNWLSLVAKSEEGKDRLAAICVTAAVMAEAAKDSSLEYAAHARTWVRYAEKLLEHNKTTATSEMALVLDHARCSLDGGRNASLPASPAMTILASIQKVSEGGSIKPGTGHFKPGAGLTDLAFPHVCAGIRDHLHYGKNTQVSQGLETATEFLEYPLEAIPAGLIAKWQEEAGAVEGSLLDNLQHVAAYGLRSEIQTYLELIEQTAAEMAASSKGLAVLARGRSEHALTWPWLPGLRLNLEDEADRIATVYPCMTANIDGRSVLVALVPEAVAANYKLMASRDWGFCDDPDVATSAGMQLVATLLCQQNDAESAFEAAAITLG